MQYLRRILLAIISLLFLGVLSCKEPDDIILEHKPTPYNLEIPRFFPSKLNIPANNPLTKEGVELGRYLFYDGHLSGRTNPDSMMSCTTCHRQENAFSVGKTALFDNGRPFGLTGRKTNHAVMPLINLVFNEQGYTWNGAVHKNNTKLGNTDLGVPEQLPYHHTSIESIVWMTIVDPAEIDGSIQRTVAVIANKPIYPPMFKAAFGTDEVNIDRICKAIAQFIRTLVSGNSKFDLYMRGEENLTADELEGYNLFMTEEGADCFHCHGGAANALFTTNLFYNNGKDNIFTDKFDRSFVTGKPSDIGAYKAPTLRNASFRTAFMHDGRFKSLDEVLEFYNENLVYSPYVDPLMHHLSTNGIQLPPNKLSKLKAFLHTLNDTSFIQNPNFSNPF